MGCRVLVVEWSGLLSRRLATLLGPPAFEPVTAPVGPAEMAEAVRAHSPSLVIAEAGGPGEALSRAIQQTMAERPVPIVLLVRDQAQRQAAMALLAAGALDVAELPERLSGEQARELSRQFELLAQVKVVMHPALRRQRVAPRLSGVRQASPVVAIAASLGGPRALATLLADLPREFGAAMVGCQHISEGFTGELARWLEGETGVRVHEAEDGEQLVKGTLLLAPSKAHLKVTSEGRVALETSAPVGGFRPSCDVLLTSAADAFRSQASGVVLTGMGSDGARGLAAIRAAGGHTIAQSEESCVVFGMPKEAIARGGAELVLPLDRIAEQLARWVA